MVVNHKQNMTNARSVKWTDPGSQAQGAWAPYDEESDRDDLSDRRWTSGSRVRHIQFGRASARPPGCAPVHPQDGRIQRRLTLHPGGSMSFVSLFGCAPVRSFYETFGLADRLLCGDFIRVDEEPLVIRNSRSAKANSDLAE